MDYSQENNGDSSGSLENDSKIGDQMRDNAVYVYMQGKDTIKCPKCRAKQTTAMNKCYRCGIRFVPAQNEGEEGQSTYVESDDATTMQNDMVKGYGNTTYAPAPVSAPKNDSDRASIAATPAAPSGQISAADEILKFKNLLDAGIITQAEFEKKKREL